MNELIAPHGGRLINLQASPERVAQLKAQGMTMPSWDLTQRQQCDLESLMNGAFSPLAGFMGKEDYARVLREMRLANGTLWPLPITLDVDDKTGDALAPGAVLALRDLEGVMLAVLHIKDVWRPDLQAEAQAVYGTADPSHPGVAGLLHNTRPVYIGGEIEGVEAPTHHSFAWLRHGPAELRQQFLKRGWRRNIAAFHTSVPVHVAQQKLSIQLAREYAANLLLQPVIEEGEDYYYRVRCYRAALEHFPAQTSLLSLLAINKRPAGIRELLWHGIVRQNYGCTHMVWEIGSGGDGYSLESPEQVLAGVRQFAGELNIHLAPHAPLVYVEDSAEYLPAEQVPAGAHVRTLTAVELTRRLHEGLDIPEWFSFPGVISELRQRYPARYAQGFTLFFTGLSGSGKSTIANAVMAKLLELGGRPVTLLDGDVVRKHLSSELGFSREHRDINILRIGFVASEITKNGGIAICAPIAPYAVTRRKVREMISPYGGFIVVYVATPLEVCEARDRKGLYAKARAGVIKEFTGISDPYEIPEKPEIQIDASGQTVEEAAQTIFAYLEQSGYVV